MNSIVNIGGFLGPTLIGVLKDRTGTHDTAFLLLGGFAIVSALIALGLRRTTVLDGNASSQHV